MPIVQLPDPNKPYLLFTDMSRFCYSGVLTQASTDESNEALITLVTDKDPLKSAKSQTQDLQINPVQFTLWHMFQAASMKANVDGLQLQRNVLASLCQSKIFLLFTKCQIY